MPEHFTVNPLTEAGSTPLKLSCNYSILQAVAAILQIVYSSLELYDASIRQIPKYGYASYSLTVIPYIVMSLANLLATICEPQYPSMFLVIYRGVEKVPGAPVDSSGGGLLQERKSPTTPGEGDIMSEESLREPLDQIIGAVGEAYGDLTKAKSVGTRAPSVK